MQQEPPDSGAVNLSGEMARSRRVAESDAAQVGPHPQGTAQSMGNDGLEQLAAIIDDVLLIVEPHGRTLHFLSPTYATMFGRSLPTMAADPYSFVEAILPDDRPQVEEAIRRQQTGAATQTEFRILHPDGSIRWIAARGYPIADEHGQLSLVANLLQDITKQKRASEEALAASEAKFAHIFYAAPDAFVITTQDDQRILDANHSFAAMSGRRREEFIGHRSYEINLILQEDYAPLAQLLARDGFVHDHACRFHTPAGGIGHALISIEPIQVDGRPCWLTIGKDITQRIAYEEQLKESRRQYRDLFDEASDGILLTDLSGRVLNASSQMCRLTGYSRIELLQLTAEDLLLPEVMAQRPALLEQLVRGQQVVREQQMRRKDGSLCPIEASIKLLADGRIQSIVRDNTARKEVERSQQHHAKTLEALYTTALQLISSEDLDDLLEKILQYASSLLGFSYGGVYLRDADTDTLILRRAHDPIFLQLGDRTTFGNGVVGRAAVTGETVAIEDYDHWPQRRPDVPLGQIGSVAGVPLKHHGQVIGVLFMSRKERLPVPEDDLRVLELLASLAALAIERVQLVDNLRASNAALAEERTQLAERVRQRTGELAQALQMKDQFLASMSHELRTPLSTILLMIQMMQKQFYGTLTDRQVRSLSTIERSSQHLLTLINDILDLSKIEAGEVALDFAPVSVVSVAEDSIEFVHELAVHKQIAVDLTVADPTIIVTADERRLKQILINLLNNAVKFTHEGGRIGLKITADRATATVHLAVWDTGIGIAAEDLKRLFMPFVQLDSGLGRRHEGTGLGLALVKRMVDLHDGQIRVESEKDKGSCFIVSLPWNAELTAEGATKSDEETPAAGAMAVAPSSANSGKLILLAEDNEPTIQVIAPFLAHHGYQVLIARNGAEAIKLAHSRHPALILMDIQMPEVDGLAAIRQLRRTPAQVDVPIIAMTALAMVGDREQCLQAGATDYLSKPVNLDTLLNLIAEWIN